MLDAGTALMGIGRASGEGRAVAAAQSAITSPLLDYSIARARGVVFNITGGADMTLQEVNEAAEVIYEVVGDDANIIFGALVDNSAGNELSLTVVATGVEERSEPVPSNSTESRTEVNNENSIQKPTSDNLSATTDYRDKQQETNVVVQK